MIRKAKKSTKYRGDSTHGWGARKKHRGAGNRGGRGNAGSGKRRKMKEPTFLAQGGKKFIGKSGMIHKRSSRKDKIINLFQLESNLQEFISKGFAKKDKDITIVDLNKAKIDKLLGFGKITTPLHVKVKSYSKKAEEKLKKVKGGVIKE